MCVVVEGALIVLVGLFELGRISRDQVCGSVCLQSVVRRTVLGLKKAVRGRREYFGSSCPLFNQC